MFALFSNNYTAFMYVAWRPHVSPGTMRREVSTCVAWTLIKILILVDVLSTDKKLGLKVLGDTIDNMTKQAMVKPHNKIHNSSQYKKYTYYISLIFSLSLVSEAFRFCKLLCRKTEGLWNQTRSRVSRQKNLIFIKWS